MTKPTRANAEAGVPRLEWVLVAIAGFMAVGSYCPAQTSASGPPPGGREGFRGVIFPRRSVSVAPRFDSIVREVLVEIGDRVEQGQALAALDTFSIEQELEMAQKLLEIAKSQLARAEREYEYANWENEIKSAFKPETFDDRPLGEVEFRRAELEVRLAEHAVEITKATIAREEANIAQLEEKLANATIRAPSPGIVGACYLEPGATVGRGTPIVRLISDELWVRFAVEEQDVARIEAGAPVTVAIDALGSKVTGTIQHLAPEVDPALGLMIVEAELASDDESTAKLKPGMVARVYLGSTTPAAAAEPSPGP